MEFHSDTKKHFYIDYFKIDWQLHPSCTKLEVFNSSLVNLIDSGAIGVDDR